MCPGSTATKSDLFPYTVKVDLSRILLTNFPPVLKAQCLTCLYISAELMYSITNVASFLFYDMLGSSESHEGS